MSACQHAPHHGAFTLHPLTPCYPHGALAPTRSSLLIEKVLTRDHPPTYAVSKPGGKAGARCGGYRVVCCELYRRPCPFAPVPRGLPSTG